MVNIVLVGKGTIGTGLLLRAHELAEQGHFFSGVADTSGLAFPLHEGGPYTPDEAMQLADQKPLYPLAMALGHTGVVVGPRSLDAVATHLLQPTSFDHVLVDTTPSADMIAVQTQAIANGRYVVSVNKKPYANGDARHSVDYLLSNALDGRVQLRGTVGANIGAPETLMQALREHPDDRFVIQGCLSGTLGYVCNQLQQGKVFSEAVESAVALGYTEPRPFDDFSGLDVARKATILGRLCARHWGRPISVVQVQHDSFLDAAVHGTDYNARVLEDLDGPAFAGASRGLDGYFADFMAALPEGHVPRYIARVSASRDAGVHVSVGLVAVTAERCLGKLDGSDNLVTITAGSHEYAAGPGPGAGVKPTTDAIIYGIDALAAKPGLLAPRF